MGGVFGKFIQKTPFFRLLLPFLLGIGAGDWVWHKWLTHTTALAAFVLYLFWGITLLLLLICLLSYKLQFSIRANWWFGLWTSLLFGCIGFTYVMIQARSLSCEWPSTSTLYQAVVTDAPREQTNSWFCVAQITAQAEVCKKSTIDKKVYLYLAKDSLASCLKSGDVILFKAQISTPQRKGNPEEFDYPRMLFRRKIAGTAWIAHGEWRAVARKVEIGMWQRILTKAQSLRSSLLASYQRQGVVGDEFAVLAAMTLGDKTSLTDDIRDRYSSVGASHILALSGLHLGILYMILTILLLGKWRTFRYRWVSQLVIIGMLWAFVVLTGLPISLIRSAIMFTLFSFGVIIGQKGVSINTLSLAAILILLANPFALFDVGFQLSFLAVFSILLLTPESCGVTLPSRPIPRYIGSLLWVSLSAQIGVAPIILYYFHYFPSYFLLTNLAVIPLAFLLIIGALLFFITTPFVWLQGWIGFLISSCVKGMHTLLSLLSNLPYSSFGPYYLTTFQAFTLYFMLACILLLIRFQRAILVTSFLISAIVATAASIIAQLCNTTYTREATLHIYNVTHSPALHLIVSPQHSYLFTVDKDSIPNALAYIAKSYWKKVKLADPIVVSADYTDSLVVYRDGVLLSAHLRAAMIHDNRWSTYRAEKPFEVDYLYLCGEFRGTLHEICRSFRTNIIVLDSSLGLSTVIRLYNECQPLGLQTIIPQYDGALSASLGFRK